MTTLYLSLYKYSKNDMYILLEYIDLFYTFQFTTLCFSCHLDFGLIYVVAKSLAIIQYVAHIQ